MKARASATAPQGTASIVLRVLTGPQAGAVAPVRHPRLMVGNLATECDVVLATDAAETIACVLRIASDGWSVTAISGELSVGPEKAAPLCPHRLQAGDVITLGPVAFTVAPGDTDFEALGIPGPLARPAPERSARRRPWVRAATGVAVLAVTGWLAVATASAIATASPEAGRPSFGDPLTLARRVLVRQAGAGELALQAVAPERYRLVGYVESAARAHGIEAALQRHGIRFEAGWTAVDTLQRALAERLAVLAGPPATALRYDGQGTFTLEATSASPERLDALSREVLASLPGLQGLAVELAPRATASAASGLLGKRWQYRREAGLIRVSGDMPASAVTWRHAVRQVRREALPSVVLDDGARYFEGATLPGGAVLESITPDRLVLRIDDALQEVPLPGPAPSPGPEADRPSG